MEWWKVVAGGAIVLFTIREMFNDLFHPTQSGVLSEWMGHRIFLLYRRWPSLLPTSGPLTVVLVIGIWALLVAFGFALIYWAWYPDAYTFQGSQPPVGIEGFSWCFYYSLEMMTTLGLGDIRPYPTWLRILSAFHTLLGFSFVTASITWIVLVFPALRRMRTLARKAITLHLAEEQTGVSAVSANMHMILAGVAEEVIQLRVDLIHFPLLFYFYAQDRRASLPVAMYPLKDLADRGSDQARDELVRLSSVALGMAVAELIELVADRLGCKDRRQEAVMRAFAELHTPPKAG